MKLAHKLPVQLFTRLRFWALLMVATAGAATAVPVLATPTVQTSHPLQQLAARAEENGSLRVIVHLDLPFRAEAEMETEEAVQRQQNSIDSLQDLVLDTLAGTDTAVIAEFKYIPYLALEIDAEALARLAELPQVAAIQEDLPVPPLLSSSVPLIGADQAWDAGFTGAGQTIAILDTGVATAHPAFTNGGSRIVSEACYSTTNAGYASSTVCPGGVESSTAPGSGVDCTAVVGPANSKAQSDCSHGTHVASIAAGNDGSSIVGVAPDADIIAIQIFSLFNSTTYCGGFSNCVLTFTSDQILGLERVYELRESHNIASVNMSLGGGQYYSPCDSDGRKAAIDNLRAAGIATVIATGNDGYRDSMGAPACISSAISVGATDDADNVAYFSNIAPFTDLVAPGVSIYAAVPNGAGIKQGTSMATPHVAGAWAVFKEAVPAATVDDALAAFRAGAVLVDDNRTSGVATDLPRIHVLDALNAYVTGLDVELTASTTYFLPGDSADLTIEAANDTGVTATQVSLSLPIPDEILVDLNSLSGDAVVANSQITWTTGAALNPGQTLSRTVSIQVRNGTPPGLITLTAAAASPDMDEVRQGTLGLNINEVVSCGFSDGFESGTLSTAWETAVTAEGRVQVLSALPNSGSFSAVLDDSTPGGAVSEAAMILTADLTGQAEALLDFAWHDLGDEYDANFDGVFIRSQPEDPWVKVYDFAGSFHDAFQDGEIDLAAAAAENELILSDRFQIKFGFSDNYPFNPDLLPSGDGYAIDDVNLVCVPSGLMVTQQVDNPTPQPGEAVTLIIRVTNNETVAATNAMIHFDMASGLALNGSVQIDGAADLPDGVSSEPPLVANGITIAAGEKITVTVPAIVSGDLAPGTVLENLITVSSDEFGTPPPVRQMIVVSPGSYQQFIPLVNR